MKTKRLGRIYPRLAFTGMVKNGRTYGPYLLTCIGMVMMYYILLFLMKSRQVAALEGGRTLQEMLYFGSGVFMIFVVIFLFYTNSFLIRSRKKEFGLYNMLGMGKRNLARILLWETGFTAVVSLAGGLFCGILFSKLAELCVAYVLKQPVSLNLELELAPILGTLKLFAGVFVLMLANAMIQIARTKPVELFHSTSVGEKQPKANWLLAVIGLLMLAAAYYIAVKIEDPMSAFLTFFAAVGMVIMSTYLLFIAGSVVLCKILMKRKSYYYKPNHFVSVSSMTYRMKRNGAGLASICILSTMVLVMLSATTCMYIGNEDRLQARYVRQIELHEYTADEAQIQKTEDIVNAVLAEYGEQKKQELAYRYLALGGYADGDQVILNQDKLVKELGVFDYANIREMYFIPLADYNRIAGAAETLNDGEVMILSEKAEYDYDTITLEGCDTWTIKKHIESFERDGEGIAFLSGSLYIIVPDVAFVQRVYEVQKEVYGENGSSWIYYCGFDIDGGAEVQMQAAERISSELEALRSREEDYPGTFVSCRAAERGDFYALYGGLFILGVLLAIVFLGATILIMYYKQVTEGYEDQARFDVMRKVGMTRREIRSSIRSQMFTVFLAPLLLAGVHTAFAFPIVKKLLLLFGVINAELLIFTTLVCFLIFALFYSLVYLATSRVYYRIVSGVQRKSA